jgi:transposase
MSRERIEIGQAQLGSSEKKMTRRQKEPLRTLTSLEKERLEQLSRSGSQLVSHVIRARLLLEVASGKSYTAAARAVGRRSGDAVSMLVSRFNREGLAAIAPRHGGGPTEIYGPAERAIILEAIQRAPSVEKEGSNRWSLSVLQKYLRSLPALEQSVRTDYSSLDSQYC